jgi:hypothetical protein
MAVKHTLAAGVAALALLIAPVGLTVQWNDHGPALATAPAVSRVHAAASRPTPKKSPADGGPTFTSSGATSKTTGYQTGSGSVDDDWCQTAADKYDRYQGYVATATAVGDTKSAEMWADLSVKVENLAGDEGCAFIY